MKHLRSFNNYNNSNVNEEFIGKVRKFFSGYESEDEFNEAKEKFEKELAEYEKEVEENPDDYVFNKKMLEENAKDNKYRGYLSKRLAGRNRDKYYIIYVDGKSGIERLATSKPDAGNW